MSKINLPKILAVDVLAKIRREIILYGLIFLGLWLGFFLALPYLFPYLLFPYFKVIQGQPLVFTSLEEALFVLLRASFYLALIVILPFFLLKVWKVISSEFYEPEKVFFRKVFFLSLGLALIGLCVGYLVFVPFLIKIFLFFGSNFEANLKINYFLFFILRVLLFSIVFFQLPLLFALLIKEEIVTKEFYQKRRVYFLGFFYGISLLIAPTDFFSQVLLTLIFFLFFKLSFVLAKIF
ncbi:twin-arginine translocase subunit TatC [Thermodesulfobacterium thermophilum]|uniref:twin-arginine translocase subunit TatC n=1 Tax=Thermodesulfobacterium thermophilum TaxID=886 RepID=UPI0003B47DED|nr:twin-arginine translocase subunit TatC [Thermodesulfobacterium thermophilum]